MSTWELGPEYGDRGRFANIYLENVTASYGYYLEVEPYGIAKWGWYNDVARAVDVAFRDRYPSDNSRWVSIVWGQIGNIMIQDHLV